MFLEETEICNFADDTIIYARDANTGNIIERLEHGAQKLTEWFPNNFIKLNEDKCHLMIFSAKGGNEISLRIGEALVKESTEENLLVIT